jgi:hypothetical protein
MGKEVQKLVQDANLPKTIAICVYCHPSKLHPFN